MDIVSVLNSVALLITALVSLGGAITGTVVAIKGWIKAFKEKNIRERWELIMKIADQAMIKAEETHKAGADKKEMVIEIVKASCAAAGLNLDDFIDQLSSYIDQTILFVNDLTK